MPAGNDTGSDALAALPLGERVALQYQVEQFLYGEAELLDQRRYRDWFELISERIHYWMPIRRTVTIADIDREFTKPGDMAYFDDDYGDLGQRIEKLYSGSSWSEDPPSRTRHFVSNVRITGVDGDSVDVGSAIHLYRSRLEGVTDHFVGRREDTLQRAGDSFKIVRRHIYLDHSVIQATNFSSLF